MQDTIDQVRGLLFVGARALGTQKDHPCRQAPPVLLLEQDLQHRVRVNHPDKSLKEALRF